MRRSISDRGVIDGAPARNCARSARTALPGPTTPRYCAPAVDALPGRGCAFRAAPTVAAASRGSFVERVVAYAATPAPTTITVAATTAVARLGMPRRGRRRGQRHR